jgi:hypothetical protein
LYSFPEFAEGLERSLAALTRTAARLVIEGKPPRKGFAGRTLAEEAPPFLGLRAFKARRLPEILG